MFLLELGPMATPFMPQAIRPLTLRLYMLSQISPHEYLAAILGR